MQNQLLSIQKHMVTETIKRDSQVCNLRTFLDVIWDSLKR